jgi:GAF domain-containing protein
MSDPTPPELADPKRLAVLRALSLMDTPQEMMFDNLTNAAASAMHMPVALITLVDANRQWFKSALVLPSPFAEMRQTSLEYSYCQYVVRNRQPLVVGDARYVGFLRDNRAVQELNLVSYLGAPIVVHGQTLGAFCVLDRHPHDWSVADIETIISLADVTSSIIQMRAQIATLLEISGESLPVIEKAGADETQETYRRLVDDARDQMASTDAHLNPKPVTHSRRPSGLSGVA